MGISFNFYGGSSRAWSLKDMLAESAKGMLLARAEQSGCEGCYIEVAKWNETAKKWQRYAFEKVFGGEDGKEPETATATAERIAKEINAAGNVEHGSFIHGLENYEEKGG